MTPPDPDPPDGGSPHPPAPDTSGARIAADWEDDDLVLVDVVNRVLDRGVMIMGEVSISVAGVPLVQLGLNLYVAATETARRAGLPGPARGFARSLPAVGDPER